VLPVAFQAACACGLLEGLKWQRAVTYERINVFDAWSSSSGASPARTQAQARAVLPLSLSFVGMIVSGFMCLKYLSVPMATIFKNATNLLIVAGEWALYHEPVSLGVLASVGLMVVGAAAAAANDLDFSAVGLGWALANAVATATYVLYMRQVTRSLDLSRFGTVLLNNALSAVLLLGVALGSGELAGAVRAAQRAAAATSDGLWRRQSALPLDLGSITAAAASGVVRSSGGSSGGGLAGGFLALNVFTGLVGFVLNFAQLWCVGATSATTYAVVGTLNKIPIALFGRFLFKAEMTTQGWVFVGVNLAGCGLYSYCKVVEKSISADGGGRGPGGGSVSAAAAAAAVPGSGDSRGRRGSDVSEGGGVEGSNGSNVEGLPVVAEQWDREARGRSGSFQENECADTDSNGRLCHQESLLASSLPSFSGQGGALMR
jgi:GDP-mannose transporter